MKLLTHTLVIYDKGWKFKFKERERNPLVIQGHEIFAWIIVLLLVLFG